MIRRINTRLFKRVAAGLVILIALAGITGFFILPPIIKPIVIEKISQALHRDVSLEKISVNPYTLSVTLEKLKIAEKGGAASFFSLEELHANLEGPASLLKRAVILNEVRLVRPYLRIVRNDDGTYNISDLIPPDEPKKEEKEPFHFSVNNIRITEGSADFEDGPMKARHTVRKLNLAVPFISNVGHAVDQYVEPKFSAQINGQPYELAGKTKPFSTTRESSFDLDIRNIDLPYYLKYVPVRLNCRLSSALLDMKVRVRFIMPEGKTPSINVAGKLALSKVVLDDARGEKILRLPALEADITSAEPLAGAIHLSRVSIRSPEFVVRKSKEGEINLLNLLAPSPGKKPEPPEKQNAASGGKKTELRARIDEFRVESGNFSFLDGSNSDPVDVRINPFNLKAVNLSTEKGSAGQVDLSLTLNQKGILTARGRLGIEPLSAELDVDAREIGIKPFQGYFADRVRITVSRGDLSTSGRMTLAPGADGTPSVRYAGKIALSRLATLDRATSGRFLGWRQLHFDQVDAGFNPLFLNIKGVSLSDFYARIAVDANGTLNVRSILGGQPAGKAAAQEPVRTGRVETAAASGNRPPPTVKIGKVTLQGGTIDFSDNFVKPNYSAKMLNVGGSVTGLSSEEISTAAVDLRGNLGAGSPIEITGKINPLIKDLFADIKLDFRDIELSPVTPYSSKFLGYPIVKGKLTFDVAYHVEKRKLEAKNRIFIDQLTFGDRVESPDAIKAPVTLAVSLLSDRNGQINLDIPLSGSLDDPEFEIWPLVWKVIANLILKAATAPFSLLASLIGGGEEMSYVEFGYGGDSIAPAGAQKIAGLTKALAERPALRLEIAGYVDPERDTEGLKRATVDRKVKVQKMKDLMRKGGAAVSLDQIRIEPQEAGRYLKLAYDAETFPKPRNVIGLAKGLPPEEMEKLMLAHTSVTPGDLRLLAHRRAEHVKEEILKTGGVQPGRIFILESPSLAPKKKEKAKESRVDFTLK